jgi:hypothetical protein
VSDPEFERRVSAALHAPVPVGARARQAIMERVRAVPLNERPVRRSRPPRTLAVRHSIVGLALAAGIGSIGTLPSMRAGRGAGAGASATAVIGDTVSATLRDTARLVRLMFDDATARHVAAVGDFNGWSADSTPLVHDATTRRWTATIALRDGAHRYAFVVDGTRWALDPSAPHVRGDDGRVYSLLNVSRQSN